MLAKPGENNWRLPTHRTRTVQSSLSLVVRQVILLGFLPHVGAPPYLKGVAVVGVQACPEIPSPESSMTTTVERCGSGTL